MSCTYLYIAPIAVNDIHFLPPVQPPMLEIQAPIPQLGANYTATCTLTVDSQIDLGVEEMEWVGSNGENIRL